MSTIRAFPARTRLVAVVLVIGALIGFAQLASRPAEIEISIQSSVTQGTVQDLVDRASALAIVKPTGVMNAHWNAADNHKWGKVGQDSYVYKEVEVELVASVTGEVPKKFTIRDLGGSADGYKVTFDGSTEWTSDETYLVFLAEVPFPTKEGDETVWTSVRLGQGVFHQEGPSWYEPIQGLTIQEKDLAAIGLAIEAK